MHAFISIKFLIIWHQGELTSINKGKYNNNKKKLCTLKFPSESIDSEFCRGWPCNKSLKYHNCFKNLNVSTDISKDDANGLEYSLSH